jgi:uncharacterized OB-fold protein
VSEEPTLHSRRALILKFDLPISKTREFWESLKNGKFVTTKCMKCGNVCFPPQSDCPKCMGGEFEWVDLGRDATLITCTHVSVRPPSFTGSDPYIIAIGEFPGGTKVLAWLEGVKREEAMPGMKLRVEGRNSAEGNPFYVFVRA